MQTTTTAAGTRLAVAPTTGEKAVQTALGRRMARIAAENGGACTLWDLLNEGISPDTLARHADQATAIAGRIARGEA